MPVPIAALARAVASMIKDRSSGPDRKLGRVTPADMRAFFVGSRKGGSFDPNNHSDRIFRDKLEDEDDPRLPIVESDLSYRGPDKNTDDWHANMRRERSALVPGYTYDLIRHYDLPDGSNISIHSLNGQNDRPVQKPVKYYGVHWRLGGTGGEIENSPSFNGTLTYAQVARIVNEFGLKHPHFSPPKEESTKLARPSDNAVSLTYVGGSKPIPGGQRAVGLWNGRAEPSAVVPLPAQHAATLAPALARRNGQESAIWFTPGAGSDSLHVIDAPANAKTVKTLLGRYGLPYATLIPNGRRTIVHLVDFGSQDADSARAFAQSVRGSIQTEPGSAGTSAIENPVKLHRVDDPDLHDALLTHARDTKDPHALGVFADYLEERGAPGAGLARAAHHAAQNGTPPQLPYSMQRTARGFVANESGKVEPLQAGATQGIPSGEMGVLVRPSNEFGKRAGVMGELFVVHQHKGLGDYRGGLGYHVLVRDLDHYRKISADLPPLMRVAIWRHLRGNS